MPNHIVREYFTTVQENMLVSQSVEDGLHVLSTPSLLGIIEKFASNMMQADVTEGKIDVGVLVQLEHLAPVACGGEILVKIEQTEVVGRFYDFDVQVLNRGREICTCKHRRAIVERRTIMAKTL